MRITRKEAITGLIVGLFVIVAWIAATKTTLIFAYGKESAPYTIDQVHGICNSGLGLMTRGLSAATDAKCSHIAEYSSKLNIMGFAGLLLFLISGVVILIKHNQGEGNEARTG